ncbi:unnamed protein product [Mytilus coruscus]|uniref:Uncharacterized protein n=1 Tax=Mytilus coruscus TaxID=42192 RepID=A0A6J8AL30_MYTCO|nr:unnamed protein product [Mytilus coruscus]
MTLAYNGHLDSKACKWGQKALASDECDHWYHATCTGIDTLEYNHLANTSVSWHCVVCNTCNYSTVHYDLFDSADRNTYSVLSSNQSYASPSDSMTSSPCHPQAASQNKGITITAGFTLSTHYQFLFINKRYDLQVLLESTRPDVTLGTESWLSDKIHSKEISPIPWILTSSVGIEKGTHMKGNHDIVLLDLAAKVTRPKPTSRTINLWKKADMEGIKKSLTDNLTEFQNARSRDINTMWNSFKNIINNVMTTYVPVKQTKERYSQPWMKTQLQKISNSKQQAYTKTKRTKNTNDWK